MIINKTYIFSNWKFRMLDISNNYCYNLSIRESMSDAKVINVHLIERWSGFGR